MRQKNKLFVGGLSADTKEEDLRSHFMQFGQVWRRHSACVWRCCMLELV